MEPLQKENMAPDDPFEKSLAASWDLSAERKTLRLSLETYLARESQVDTTREACWKEMALAGAGAAAHPRRASRRPSTDARV